MIARTDSTLNVSSSAPRGFLIDLDLAKIINPENTSITTSSNVSSPATPRKRTGTMIFMAIEVLQGATPHTWRHDLESFLYVLIWLCISKPRDRQLDALNAVYDKWAARDAANNKYVEMTNEAAFNKLVALFAPSMTRSGVGWLVAGLRKCLFPIVRSGGDWGWGYVIGTEGLGNRGRVYSTVVRLFDEMIGKLPVD